MKRRNLSTVKTICLMMSFAMLMPFFVLSSAANEYYEDVNERYYFGNSQWHPYDYAETYVSEYGDWIEGEPIPTDFEARTFGMGLHQMPNYYKIMKVDVYYYDPGYALASHDTDMVEISWYTYSGFPTEGVAVSFGDGQVNEEYGLYEFTSYHYLFIHYDDGEYEETFPIADTIVIDTTGFCR